MRHYTPKICQDLEEYEREIEHIANESNEGNFEARLAKLHATNPEREAELAALRPQRAQMVDEQCAAIRRLNDVEEEWS